MSTTHESPSALLERAAARVEELAKAATLPAWVVKDLAGAGHRGVWWVEAHYQTEEVTGSQCVAELETVNPRADAAWIATLSPAIAAPLASMLRFDAMRLGWAERCEEVDGSYLGFELARQILGDPLPDYYGKEE